jgi:hypothetical protein
MVLSASTSDLTAVSNTTLKSKGAIESHCLKTLLAFNSNDKCLQILTVAHISLFIILDNLTIFFGGGADIVYAFHYTFPFSI